MTALLPCPFCGGHAQVVSGAPGCHYVRCEGCGTSGDDRSPEKAIAIWNRRAAFSNQAARIAELETERDEWNAAHREACDSYSDLATALTASRAECEELRAALEFYADTSKYPAPFTGGFGELYFDCGQIARAALSRKETGA